MKKNMSIGLKLNKETVCHLNRREMKDFHGGATWTVGCEPTWEDFCGSAGISVCIGVCPSINVPCASQHIECEIVIKVAV